MRKILFLASVVVAAGQQLDREMLKVPGWFAMFEPENEKIVEKTVQRISLSYDANSSFLKVVGDYENILRNSAIAGISYDEGGNGHGTTFRISSVERFCLLDVGNQAKPHVDLRCEDTRATEKSTEYLRYLALHPQPKLPEPLPPGVHQIEYVIDGTCNVAGITLQNGGGGTEQHQVTLPVVFTFRATPGAFLYVSAQNKGEDGTMHVAIKVDGTVVRQSKATAPYGIASASGKL